MDPHAQNREKSNKQTQFCVNLEEHNPFFYLDHLSHTWDVKKSRWHLEHTGSPRFYKFYQSLHYHVNMSAKIEGRKQNRFECRKRNLQITTSTVSYSEALLEKKILSDTKL